jgi:hypothetical protein
LSVLQDHFNFLRARKLRPLSILHQELVTDFKFEELSRVRRRECFANVTAVANLERG